jgi:hypothetical protein
LAIKAQNLLKNLFYSNENILNFKWAKIEVVDKKTDG